MIQKKIVQFAPREEPLIRSITNSGWRFYLWIAFLGAIVLWGGYAYTIQLREGLAVTGMRDYVSWGLYITNFVFFIGISHAGTLISAILRVTSAGWRRPITRMAEAITVFALMVGAPMVIVDMGRPDRILNILLHGRVQSPILWDVISITTYLTGSLLYLYLPMIPDLALLRDGLKNAPWWRRTLYGVLSLGWQGNPEQRLRLEKGVAVMAVLIIPIAVSVHTVVSWIFGMTARPGWHSSIFGPYFVIGAIFSGIASIIIAMALFRRVFHLEEYITVRHFRNLGYLFLALNLIYVYFTLSEYLTGFYTSFSPDAAVLSELFTGQYAFTFWSMVGLGFVLPALMIAVPPLLPTPRAAVRRLVQVPALGAAAGMVLIVLFVSRQATSAVFLGSGVFGSSLGLVLIAAALGIFILILPELKEHPIAATVLAAVLANVAMWVKRYLIVVPTLQNPFIPIPALTPTEWARYAPTWVEWSITAGAFAAFILFYSIFSKVFPIVSLWETREETAEPHPVTATQKREAWL